MRIPKFTHFFAAALLLAAFAVTAAAQTTTASGKVTLKQADGTEVPVAGALVEIHRTDIKQNLKTKTDKKGQYVYAGLDLTGTFTIIVSAPGATPSYISNVRVSQRPNNDFTLQPGDGSTLTLAEVKAASAGGASKTGTTAAAPKASAGGTTAASTAGSTEKAPAEAPLTPEEAKKKQAEYEKQVAEIAAKNAKIEERNAKLPVVFKAANDAFSAKNYDEAINLYDQAIGIDPTEAVVYRNKSIVLRTRAVERYNAAAKAKDLAGKEAARADLKLATETAEKAVAAYRTPQADRVAAAPGAAKNEDLDYLFQRAESYRVALQTNAQVDTEAGIKAFQEYIAAETDTAKKTKAEASLGDALFQGGRVDESIAAYKAILANSPNNLDAIYGLGLALASDPTGAKTAEGRDMLEQFASKAPATDPRKQMAEEAVAGLNEALKPKPADKATTTTKRRKT
ncbi:MAG TPA: carboxypeptidase regulatory-like domain-containing protein [Pyrinomonadaceae bacterium]|nr:carboxypeptidase regulatory-like domain-containing protein [Pyrinomonadaceae bacterium]